MTPLKTFCCTVVLLSATTACTDTSNTATHPSDDTSHAHTADSAVTTPIATSVPTTPDPEDDPSITGTNVLGFKLQASTFESVKKRLENYHFDEYAKSYAGGYILENDGTGFGIEGLNHVQFGFDTNQKLVYVFMQIHESDPMDHTTYKKIVSYVKQNDYTVVGSKEPFVGDRETRFKTPRAETITVSSPHMGDFQVYVEYYTEEFGKMRKQAQHNAKTNQQQTESKNF